MPFGSAWKVSNPELIVIEGIDFCVTTKYETEIGKNTDDNVVIEMTTPDALHPAISREVRERRERVRERLNI